MTSSTTGLDIMGGRDRYCFSCWNATTHSSDHSNSFLLCNKRKKGLHLSADLDMNRFKAAIILVSFVPLWDSEVVASY